MKASNKLRLFDIWKASIYNKVGDDGFISMVWTHQDEIDQETAREDLMCIGHIYLSAAVVRSLLKEL